MSQVKIRAIWIHLQTANYESCPVYYSLLKWEPFKYLSNDVEKYKHCLSGEIASFVTEIVFH